MNQSDPSLGSSVPTTYAAACWWAHEHNARRFRGWAQALVVGAPLPTLPLWLSDDLVVPLDLEVSYEKTCQILRMP